MIVLLVPCFLVLVLVQSLNSNPMLQTSLLVGTNNGFCVVFMSIASALRLDCTVPVKSVEQKIILGRVGGPGSSGFRFYEK